jgi:hypothetical protein
MDRKSLCAEEAAAARYRKRDDDPVAAAQVRYPGANLLDYTHELVTHHQRLELGKEPVVQVQVRTTNRSGGDPQDDITRTFQTRIVNPLYTYVFGL